MFKSITFFVFTFLLIACTDEDEATKRDCHANTPATIKDLTGLDGCGFVFELEDGTRLEPIRTFRCGTPPITEEQLYDPLQNFVFQDGKKVFIEYVNTQAVSVCMVGQTVIITCIKEVAMQDKNPANP